MYNKEQIQEAGKTLVKMLDQEDFDNGYIDTVYCVVDDLLLILDGKLKPKPKGKKDVLLIAGMGFVPVLGNIVADEKLGNRVEWFGEEDHASNDS